MWEIDTVLRLWFFPYRRQKSIIFLLIFISDVQKHCPRNRVIPFGYCMKNGEITTEPKEVYAVAEIFREYLNGSSLLQIAKLMESENIRYTEDSDHWNKNMVKRIIENEKHLGTDKYPQIIDEDIFNQANEKRIRKANTLNLVCDDLQEIRKVTYCLECGEKLFRKTNGKGREYWNCGNPDCFGEVRTYLNSGNVIFSSDIDEIGKLTKQIEVMIKNQFVLNIPVFVISRDELEDILRNAPEWWGKDNKDIYDNLIFIMPPTAFADVYSEIGEPNDELEKIQNYKEAIFWSFSRKDYQKTNWWSKTASANISSKLTIRTANTVRKIAGM